MNLHPDHEFDAVEAAFAGFRQDVLPQVAAPGTAILFDEIIHTLNSQIDIS